MLNDRTCELWLVHLLWMIWSISPPDSAQAPLSYEREKKLRTREGEYLAPKSTASRRVEKQDLNLSESALNHSLSVCPGWLEWKRSRKLRGPTLQTHIGYMVCLLPKATEHAPHGWAGVSLESRPVWVLAGGLLQYH